MNKINITPLKSTLEKVRAAHEQREEFFTDKSEKWQESEKGQQFECRTEELQYVLDELENVIDALENWNEDGLLN